MGMRVEIDARNEKLGYRVREAQINKIPYQIVVGDGEVENESVTIRKRGTRKTEQLPLEQAKERFAQEIDSKALFTME